jgi:hypothetical protein
MHEPGDEELLIRAANRERDRQRAGKTMVIQSVIVLVFLALGWWLVFGVRLSGPLHYGALVFGIAAFVNGAWFLPGAVELSPLAPWGDAVPGACSRCGQRRLRKDSVLHWTAPGSGQRSVRGVVTLCLADCGYASFQDIVANPAGGLP